MYFLNKRVVFASLCSPNFYSYLIQTQLRQRKQKKESHSGNQSSSHRRRSSSQSPKPHSGFNYFLKEQSTVLEYNKKYFKHLTYITIFHCPFVNSLYIVLHTMGIHYVTSVPQKSIPSAVVIHYCAWYTFLPNRCYCIW